MIQENHEGAASEQPEEIAADMPKPLGPAELARVANAYVALKAVQPEDAECLLSTAILLARSLQNAQRQAQALQKEIEPMAAALAGLTVMVASGTPVPCQRQHGVKAAIVPKAVFGTMNRKTGNLTVVDGKNNIKVSWTEPPPLVLLARNLPHDPTPNPST